MENPGGEFLHQINPKLHLSQPVKYEASKNNPRDAENNSKPADKITSWLKVIEKTHTSHRDNPEVLERIKRSYHKEYVIKPSEVPQSYWNSQAEKMIKEGRGGDFSLYGIIKQETTLKNGTKTDYIFPPETIQLNTESIIADQKESLNKWINYFTDPSADVYPTWFKHWAFTSMVEIGKLDKENHTFSKRLKGTVAPFPELDRTALAYVQDILIKKYTREYFDLQEEIDETNLSLREISEFHRKLKIMETGKDPQGRIMGYKDLERISHTLKTPKDTNSEELSTKFTELIAKQQHLIESLNIPAELKGPLGKEDFGTLYAYAIEKTSPTKESNLLNTNGEWILYKQNSEDSPNNHIPLVESLQGFSTGWCTAGEEVAKTQLNEGDFYVYYSYDQDGIAKIPRVAIRKSDGKIAEIRGIAKDQNLDPYIGDILENKLQDKAEFPDAEEYKQKVANMKLLSEINDRIKGNIKLNQKDLRFLYELDHPIEGFGYEKDPRIEELRLMRVDKNTSNDDIPIIFDCQPEQIAHVAEEINADTFVYIGPLYPEIFDKLPPNVRHIYTSFQIESFYQEKEITKDTIIIGKQSKAELLQHLSDLVTSHKIDIDHRVNEVLKGYRLKTSNTPEEVRLITLRVSDLGLKYRPTIDDVCRRAQHLGLELCPLEIVISPELLDKYRSESAPYTLIATEKMRFAPYREGIIAMGPQYIDSYADDSKSITLNNAVFIFRQLTSQQKEIKMQQEAVENEEMERYVEEANRYFDSLELEEV